MIKHALAAVGCALACGTNPAAAADGTVAASYVVSWGGMDVGELRAEVVETGDRYRAVWSGRTTGLIGTLFPFTSAGAAQGRREGEAYVPNAFEGRSQWRDGSGAWRVEFGPDGRATAVQISAADLADREPVPVTLQQGPDPATLMLTALAAAAPGAGLTAASFDGKRAVGYALACAAAAVGDELACTIESRLLAGASRRWRERQPDSSARPAVQVWLRPSLAADGLWPVRVEGPPGSARSWRA